jgi:hypothetical protein
MSFSKRRLNAESLGFVAACGSGGLPPREYQTMSDKSSNLAAKGGAKSAWRSERRERPRVVSTAPARN